MKREEVKWHIARTLSPRATMRMRVGAMNREDKGVDRVL